MLWQLSAWQAAQPRRLPTSCPPAAPRCLHRRQMLLQRAGFVRRLSDSEEEDAPQAGGAGGSAAGRTAAGGSRPAGAARVRGAAVAPAAASLWEEELSEASEDTGIDGDAFMQQQFAAAKAAAVGAAAGNGAAAPQDQQPSADGDNQDPEGAWRQAGAAAASAGQQQQQPRPGGSAPAQPKPAEKPPPALPKFGVRPVAVVVKRKAEGEAAGAKPAKQQPLVDAGDSDGGSPAGGMGALLAGYGSSGGESS